MATEEYFATLPLREATWNDVALAFEAGKRDQKSTPCHWREDFDGVWETDCGQAFVLDSGTPAENSMKFCGYCGQPLKEMLYQEDEIYLRLRGTTGGGEGVSLERASGVGGGAGVCGVSYEAVSSL